MGILAPSNCRADKRLERQNFWILRKKIHDQGAHKTRRLVELNVMNCTNQSFEDSLPLWSVNSDRQVAALRGLMSCNRG